MEWDLRSPCRFALEEYEQIEVLSGVGGSMYGPSNPSGTFNFVTKTTHRRTAARGRVGV